MLLATGADLLFAPDDLVRKVADAVSPNALGELHRLLMNGGGAVARAGRTVPTARDDQGEHAEKHERGAADHVRGAALGRQSATRCRPARHHALGAMGSRREHAHGGGIHGQASAVRLGLARALVEFNAELRPRLKKLGYLTRDARKRERKKYGQKGARKRFQFSKR